MSSEQLSVNQCVVCGRSGYEAGSLRPDQYKAWGKKIWLFGPDLCSACALSMKGLSLWQPWAGFIALGEKTIETRFWTTAYRGPLLICSARKFDTDWRRISSRPNAGFGDHGGKHKLGRALCVANLVQCRPMEKRDEDASMVRFALPDKVPIIHQRYSWVLEDVRPVTPFAVIGRQRLFHVTESILRKVG